MFKQPIHGLCAEASTCTNHKNVSWPTPQDYNEAIQIPSVCFADPELRLAHPELTSLGLPKPNSGAFASVYKMTYGQKHWAVRCFLRNVANQHERYKQISNFVLNDELPYTVDFAYLEQGINIHGTWYPILKMDWVDGQTLDAFVRTHLDDARAINQLVTSFRVMHSELQKFGIAHGDLQHGNVIVTPERELRLVDYDGMFVPKLSGQPSNELGHPNYQHPQRNGYHFDHRLDNFSCWVIETSLRALSIDPTLSKRFNACDDALLFRRNDFTNPRESPVFYFLERHGSEEIRRYSRWLRVQTMEPLASVNAPAEVVDGMPELIESPPASTAWYHNSDSGQSVDWAKLKDFYAVTHLPRAVETNENTENERAPHANQLIRLRNLLECKRPQGSAFEIKDLETVYYRKKAIELKHGVSLLAVNALIALAVPLMWVVFVIANIVLWTRLSLILSSMRKSFQKYAKIILSEEPVDLVLQCRDVQNIDMMTLKVARAPASHKILVGWETTLDAAQKRRFREHFGSVTSIRALVFLHYNPRKLIAILKDDDTLLWLI